MRPGHVRKYDYEYRRNGTCNIFVAIEPKAGKHHIQVTDTRTRQDFLGISFEDLSQMMLSNSQIEEKMIGMLQQMNSVSTPIME